MILEVAVMTVKPECIKDFEAAFPKAAAISASCEGYISHEIERCIETKGKYYYMIRWESVEAHEKNFRQTPKRQQFRDAIGQYWANPPQAEHFEAITEARI